VSPSFCSFGSRHRKDLRLAVLRAPFLKAIDRPCTRDHDHVVLQGSLTAHSAQYIPELCHVWALAAKNYHQAEAPNLGADDVHNIQECNPSSANETIWMIDWIRGANWNPIHAQPHSRRQHINILELDEALHVQMAEARTHVNCKQVMFLDSRVAIGVGAKGRAATKVLNRCMRRALPTFVGCNYYPGYAFCPTRLNPSDGLSRCREWQWDPGPSPPWPHGLATGDPRAFSLWSTVPKQGFRLAEWVRITLKLWWS